VTETGHGPSFCPSGPDYQLESLRLAVALYTGQGADEGTVLHTAAEFHDRLTRDRDITPGTAREILQSLVGINRKLDIMSQQQDDINAAVAQDNSLLADLGTQVQAVADAQAKFDAEIVTLRGQGVDTSGLVAANQQLAAAQAPLDAAVSALTSDAAGTGASGDTGTAPAAPSGTSN
jgi:hypothetical protein